MGEHGLPRDRYCGLFVGNGSEYVCVACVQCRIRSVSLWQRLLNRAVHKQKNHCKHGPHTLSGRCQRVCSGTG